MNFSLPGDQQSNKLEECIFLICGTSRSTLWIYDSKLFSTWPRQVIWIKDYLKPKVFFGGERGRVHLTFYRWIFLFRDYVSRIARTLWIFTSQRHNLLGPCLVAAATAGIYVISAVKRHEKSRHLYKYLNWGCQVHNTPSLGCGFTVSFIGSTNRPIKLFLTKLGCWSIKSFRYPPEGGSVWTAEVIRKGSTTSARPIRVTDRMGPT